MISEQLHDFMDAFVASDIKMKIVEIMAPLVRSFRLPEVAGSGNGLIENLPFHMFRIWRTVGSTEHF